MKLSQKPRSLRGSGYLFTSNSSIISTGDSFNFTIDKRFIPYDDVLVVNLNSSNDCQLDINWGKKQPLPKGNSINIDTPIEALRVINNGSGSIAVGELEVYYRKSSETPKLIQDGGSALSILHVVRSFF